MTPTGAVVYAITGKSLVKRVIFSGSFMPMVPRYLQAGFVMEVLPDCIRIKTYQI
jgi:hypothetical protein